MSHAAAQDRPVFMENPCLVGLFMAFQAPKITVCRKPDAPTPTGR